MKPKLETIDAILQAAPPTIEAMLKLYDNEFYSWQSESIYSGGHYPSGTDERDRANRCYDAAENGADGSTHAENIQDFRKFGQLVFGDLGRALRRIASDDEIDAAETKLDAVVEQYEADCDSCEQWHEQNGSLNQQVG